MANRICTKIAEKCADVVHTMALEHVKLSDLVLFSFIDFIYFTAA